MEEVTFMTFLMALHYSGANEIVKKTSSGICEWIKSKLTRKASKENLDKVKVEPDNKELQNKLKFQIEDAIENEELDLSELKAELDKFKKILEEHDPSSLNTSNVIDSENVLVNQAPMYVTGGIKIGS